MKQSLLSLCFPLADTLSITLKPWQDANSYWHLTADTKNSWDYEIAPGVEIPVNVSVQGSYLREGVSSILVHVIGDLYLYVYYLAHTDKITVLVLDGGKFNKLKVQHPRPGQYASKYDVADKAFDYPPSEFIEWAKPAVKGKYRKPRTSKEWGKLDDLSDLDNGQAGNPSGGDKEPSIAVGG